MKKIAFGSLVCVMAFVHPLTGNSGDPYGKIASLSYDERESVKRNAAKCFDFSVSSNSDILLEKLNNKHPKKRNGASVHWVMKILLENQPENALEWLLDHFNDLNTDARSSVVVSLEDSDYQEGYQILLLLLADKSELIDSRNEQMSLAMPSWRMRICDIAYNSLVKLINSKETLFEDDSKVLHAFDEIGKRDRSIERLKHWWGVNSEKHLQKKISLSVKRPSLSNKMHILSEKSVVISK